MRFLNLAFCLSLTPNHSGSKESIEIFDLAVRRELKLALSEYFLELRNREGKALRDV